MKDNKLLDLLSQREELSKTIKESLISFADNNSTKQDLIYFSSHAFIQWLDRIKNIKLDDTLSDKENLAKYMREENIKSEDFRQMILTTKEQEYIVRNDLSMYFKYGFIYIIKKLTLITIYQIPDDWLPNFNTNI